MYRTPEEIRAIPNRQWEQWLREGTVPFLEFPASRECQAVLRGILNATHRRMRAK